jgi:hypothetical protein
MSVGPLRYDMRIAAKLVRLEPCLDVGRDELALLLAGRVSDDRSKHARDPIAQRVVRRRETRRLEAVASYEAAEGRGWKYSSLVKG